MTDPRIRPEFASPQHVKLAKQLVAKFPDPAPSDKVRREYHPLEVGLSSQNEEQNLGQCVCPCVFKKRVEYSLGCPHMC